jgi:hypothetical protein
MLFYSNNCREKFIPTILFAHFRTMDTSRGKRLLELGRERAAEKYHPPVNPSQPKRQCLPSDILKPTVILPSAYEEATVAVSRTSVEQLAEPPASEAIDLHREVHNWLIHSEFEDVEIANIDIPIDENLDFLVLDVIPCSKAISPQIIIAYCLLNCCQSNMQSQYFVCINL